MKLTRILIASLLAIGAVIALIGDVVSSACEVVNGANRGTQACRAKPTCHGEVFIVVHPSLVRAHGRIVADAQNAPFSRLQ